MGGLKGIWTSITCILNFLTLSPVKSPSAELQAPLVNHADVAPLEELKYPIFKPPGRGHDGIEANFTCEYPEMPGCEPCSTAEDRSCWLTCNDGRRYDINTNYEDTDKTPIGIHRTYYLNLTDEKYNADGLLFEYGKFFNSTYPGPWIQGCWGDNITVIVNNLLRSNGTSVHWHGIRQWQTMHMDGVNGVTQCPIAPGDSFNYTFRAMQYGSSWYHSHYSVQYADGAVGPLTLHGPTSLPFDEARDPIIMTDWGHNSAFEATFTGLVDKSILLNGVGNITRFTNTTVNQTNIPDPFTLHFDPPTSSRPKSYLLRLINTAFDSTFVFSIDNHKLQIVSADFVPIHNYTNTSVLVGIGQRYNVIVLADPEDNQDGPRPSNDTFWIRTWKADCFRFDQSQASQGYEKSGILRYSDSQSRPITTPWDPVSKNCSDETYTSLKPILPWTVPPVPANGIRDGGGEDFTVEKAPEGVDPENIYPLAFFSISNSSAGNDSFVPLRIDYSDPTFLHLNYSGKWDADWVVVPENYSNSDWVFMVFKSVPGKTTGAHPIHLHGHDFAILQQMESTTFPDQLNLKLDNPPRRDVVLLPNDGYVVIAFKTDNPGTWLVHCHIADHAAMGLAMQIMERQQAAAEIWPGLAKSHALDTAQRGCDNWNRWWGDCKNWWHFEDKEDACGTGDLAFIPDSGI